MLQCNVTVFIYNKYNNYVYINNILTKYIFIKLNLYYGNIDFYTYKTIAVH